MTIISSLMGALDSIYNFLCVYMADVFACITVLIVYFLSDKNLSLFGGLGYSYISQMNREAYSMLYDGEEPEAILKKLREMRFGFHLYPSSSKKHARNIAFAKTVLANDDLMYKYVIMPRFDRRSFKALKKDVSEIESIVIQSDIAVNLKCILKDSSKENMNKMESSLAAWHTEPALVSKIGNDKCNTGKNVTYIFFSLKDLGIIKAAITYDQYIDCLKALKKAHPDMSIVQSKGSISFYVNKGLDPELLNKTRAEIAAVQELAP